MVDMRLTEHFYLSEFIVSQSATREGIDNTPTKEITDNLIVLAEVMEKVRNLLVYPIIVTSGYRCPELNKRIGGAVTSAHMKGLAADFICPGAGSPLVICRKLVSFIDEFKIDQLIFEQTWVHIGLSVGSEPRRQILTYIPGAGYRTGLPT